jgi:nucleoside-diphosphate kinase
MEQTLVLVKPDGIDRGLAGAIIQRLENKGFQIAAMKMVQIDETLAKQHYQEHLEKSFFPLLLKFITSGPSIAMVLSGKNVIAETRRIVGSTNPQEAIPGTIRGDFGIITTFNLVHASDSQKSSDREIPIFFKPEEILKYTRSVDKWFHLWNI